MRTTSVLIRTLSQGSTIYKCGTITGDTQGMVASTSFAMNVGTVTYYGDLGLANYYSDGGDSGGLVYQLHTDGTTAYPVGIHNMHIGRALVNNTGLTPTVPPYKDQAYRGYCKINNVLNTLGVSIIS